MNRIVNVLRMQMLTKSTFIWVPLLILSATFLITLAIWSMIPGDGFKYGGGIQAPLWYILAMGVQAVSLTFPFSQALSVTRREFYIGSMLMGALTITALTVVVGVLGFIEQATNGWGMNGLYFRMSLPLWDESPLLVMLIFLTAGMFLFTMGFLFATIYRRWGTVAVVAFGVALGVVLLGILAVIGRFDLWLEVSEFFVTLGSWGTLAIGAVITVIVAIASYTPLRRSVA